MATPQRALVLSQLQLGLGILPRELRDVLSSLANGPPVELVVAGGLFNPQWRTLEDAGAQGPEVRDALEFIARALPAEGRLTLLPGGGPLSDPAAQQQVLGWLGRKEGEVLFGEELRPGVIGHAIQAEEGVIWTLAGDTLDPLAGVEQDALFAWGALRNFVRAFSKQVATGVNLPEPDGPGHAFAQAVARAIGELSRRKEGESPEVSRMRYEGLLGEVARWLEARAADAGAAISETVGGVLAQARVALQDHLIQKVRQLSDDAAAVVVVGRKEARAAEEEAPFVYLTGSASGDPASWVEISLLGALRVNVRSSRPPAPAPVAPPPPTVTQAAPAEAAPVAPPPPTVTQSDTAPAAEAPRAEAATESAKSGRRGRRAPLASEARAEAGNEAKPEGEAKTEGEARSDAPAEPSTPSA